MVQSAGDEDVVTEVDSEDEPSPKHEGDTGSCPFHYNSTFAKSVCLTLFSTQNGNDVTDPSISHEIDDTTTYSFLSLKAQER
jgi:hypothetical protein